MRNCEISFLIFFILLLNFLKEFSVILFSSFKILFILFLDSLNFESILAQVTSILPPFISLSLASIIFRLFFFAIFYDIENPNRFCEDIYNLLDENGIWILEFSYLPLMLKNLTFDQICHEHVTYYGLKTFKKIAKDEIISNFKLDFPFFLKNLKIFFLEKNSSIVKIFLS